LTKPLALLDGQSDPRASVFQESIVAWSIFCDQTDTTVQFDNGNPLTSE
jgi:hypothetical protein